MKRPQSNGLFEVTGGQEKERGFCCMKLITFLSANNVTDWETSGIRLGTPAITTRGAKEDLMLEIAEMIETVLSNVENEEVIAQVRARVNETMKKYPLFAY